jgi:hypothetical protein
MNPTLGEKSNKTTVDWHFPLSRTFVPEAKVQNQIFENFKRGTQRDSK